METRRRHESSIICLVDRQRDEREEREEKRIAPSGLTPFIRHSFNTGRSILQNLPSKLLLGLLRLHTKSEPISAHLILQARHDTDRLLLLLAAKTVRGADHLSTLHCLRVPVVAIETGFKVGIAFCLQEVIVVALLSEEVHVVVLAVVADLFDHGADGGFVFFDKLAVFNLLVFENVYYASFFGEGAF